MGSICAEQHHHQHHKFHHSHQLHINKKLLREINIPPRIFLSRRASTTMPIDSDHFMDVSPKLEETLFHKFLPFNNIHEDEDGDDDPYSSEQFRMYEFKVRKCTRSRSHDWTDCPFAHLGEKARRRDPRRYHYSGTICPEFRRGHCSRGDNCEFAHGVFECWLHPARYRTEACKDGKNCKRKICFFAHTPRQLRLLPIENPSSPMDSPSFDGNIKPCCEYCHSRVASPKPATVMEMCHASSPMSPAKPARFSPVSRYKDQFSGGMRYNDAMIELMNSLEAMQLNYDPTSDPIIAGSNLSFNGGQDHNQLVFSSPSNGRNKFVGDGGNFSNKNLFEENENSNGRNKFVGDGGNFSNKNLFEENENNIAEPDLGWVNDLLV